MAFLQYTAGAIPGKPLKRKVTTEDMRDRKKKYEKDRERKFLESWKQDRPWLHHNGENNVMICNWCIEASGPKDLSFVKGCENFKISAIKDHEMCKFHLKIAPRYTTPVEESPAVQCIKLLNQNEIDKLSIKFRNAHYVAKHNKPFTEYTQLCKLDIAKGLDVGTSYVNRKGAALLMETISAVTSKSVVASIQNAKFLSFTCDGCTDFTGDEYESLYVRHASGGIVYDQFIKIGIPESGCSLDIKNFISSVFESVGLLDAFNDRLIGFCADGASNMQGKKTGLAGLLKKDRPELVVIHCLAHRLELCFKDVVAKNKLYDKVITLLLGLYYLYRKSPKMKKGLQISFKSLNRNGVLPTGVGGTRWLPHLARAISNFEKGYKAIRNHLETASHENSKAEGLAKIAADGNVLVFMMSLKLCRGGQLYWWRKPEEPEKTTDLSQVTDKLYQVVITPLMKLSLGLQREGLTLADACLTLSLSKSALSLLRNEDDLIQEIIAEGKYQDLDVKFRGQKIDNKIEMLSQSMIQYIDKRIPESPFIKATSLSNFGNWPCDQSDLTGYGKEDIVTLTNHFEDSLKRADVDTSLVPTEWDQLKLLVFEKFRDKLEQCTLRWKEVNRLKVLGYEVENVLAVIDLILSLPPTSVRNECSFSIMKLAKGRRRARMNPDTLNNLLTISLMGQSIEEFNPKECIDHFLVTPSGRSRRIKGYQKPGNKIPEKVVIGDDATNISTEDQELHATDSESVTESTDEPQATRTTANVNVSTTERLLQQCTKFDDSDDNGDDDEYSDDDDNELDEQEITKLLSLYSRE